MNVQEFYEKTLVDRGYQSDPAQLAAVGRLQRAFDSPDAHVVKVQAIPVLCLQRFDEEVIQGDLLKQLVSCWGIGFGGGLACLCI